MDLIAMMHNHIPSCQDSLRNLVFNLRWSLLKVSFKGVNTPHLCLLQHRDWAASEGTGESTQAGKVRSLKDTCNCTQHLHKIRCHEKMCIEHRNICYWNQQNNKMLETTKNQGFIRTSGMKWGRQLLKIQEPDAKL